MSGATKLMTAGGGGVSLTPASSIASDVTVNVPSQNCTLGIQGPAFSAYASSAQTLSRATFTKLTLDSELFDTNNNYDTSTSRFTPSVAGYYKVDVSVSFQFAAGAQVAVIYKNGGQYEAVNNQASLNVQSTAASSLIYMNGTTDYLEFVSYADNGVGSQATFYIGAYIANFSACLVRAA